MQLFVLHLIIQVKFVYVNSKEFLATKNESYSIYVKYQMTIHKDAEEECDLESFENFLIETPLEVFTLL